MKNLTHSIKNNENRIDKEIYDQNISWPKISIVTPSYNQGDYIEETILSIINQDYPNLEYIIIDGGSTDNTIEIIRKYESHIDYWVSEPDKGQSHAINKGITKCTGDVFNWINSDDYLEEQALYYIGKAFVDNASLQVVCGNCRIFGKPQDNGVYQMFVGKNEEETFLKYQIAQQSTFWKLSAVKDVGNINQSLNYIFDLELWWKYIAEFGQKNILQINNLISHFRYHNDSKSMNESHRFDDERYALYCYVLDNFSIPDYLIKLLPVSEQHYSFDYNFTNSKYINYNMLFLHFAKRYYLRLNAQEKFAETKFILTQLLKNRMLDWNFQNFKLLIKYFLIPKKVLIKLKN